MNSVLEQFIFSGLESIHNFMSSVPSFTDLRVVASAKRLAENVNLIAWLSIYLCNDISVKMMYFMVLA